MNKNPAIIARNDALLLAISKGEPLPAALQNAGLSPARALQVLDSNRTRSRLYDMKQLIEHQEELIRRTSLPDALAIILRALRDDQHPALQFKAAQTLLLYTLPKPRHPNP